MIFIGLGANISSKFGEPVQTLLWAFDQISSRYQAAALSSFYLSAPMYKTDQEWFVNAVCAFQSDESPGDILRYLQGLEVQAGRVRAESNGPRPLDLDILDYNQQELDSNVLSLPHPGIEERGFVLYPLQELAPDWVHPVKRTSIASLIAALPPGQDLEKMAEVKDAG